MVSSPTAKRSSASGEKTACSSRSGSGRSAAAQSSLSRPASTALLSQSVATSDAKELRGRINGALDLGRSVRRRHEHGLELGRGEVDAALEEVAEELPVALGVGALGGGEVADRPLLHEDGEHRADALHGDAGNRQARLEGGGGLL